MANSNNNFDKNIEQNSQNINYKENDNGGDVFGEFYEVNSNENPNDNITMGEYEFNTQGNSYKDISVQENSNENDYLNNDNQNINYQNNQVENFQNENNSNNINQASDYIEDDYQNNYQNNDYENDLGDDDYQENNYSDDYSYEQNYDNNYPDIKDSEPLGIDNLLKDISKKLEKLEAREERTPVSNTPFYAQNPMPYVLTMPNQGSGNDVILNELAKLREENYKMQHNQEMQRQLSILKDELNAKLATLNADDKNNKPQKHEDNHNQKTQDSNERDLLLEEFKKLNNKIGQLESKSNTSVGSEQFKQLSEQLKQLEAKISSKPEVITQQQVVMGDETLVDLTNQVRYSSLKSDDVLAYIKSIRYALGLSSISHVEDNGEIDYSELEQEFTEFKSAILSGSLYTKLSSISKFNELMSELPYGEREDIASEFYKIRNKIFGTLLTPEIAAELITNTSAADKERDIYYYFELKGELDRASVYEVPTIADKILRLRNRLQNNQYVAYNQNLYNDLINANNEFVSNQTLIYKEKLKRAKDAFSTLRVGDIISINDYQKIRPTINYRTISDKLNEVLKYLKEQFSSKPQENERDQIDTLVEEIKTLIIENDIAKDNKQTKTITEDFNALKDSLITLNEEKHKEFIAELNSLKNSFVTAKDTVNTLPASNISVNENEKISKIQQDMELVLALLSGYPNGSDNDVKAQIIKLQEEIREKLLNKDDSLLNGINQLKEQISILTDYSDVDDVPSVSNETLMDEIKSLKEDIYITKGEIDPEIFTEIRNLKELLAASRKEESYKDIIYGLENLDKKLSENSKSNNENYTAQINEMKDGINQQIEQLSLKTDSLSIGIEFEQVLKEIASLRDQINTITIPTVIHDGDKVKFDYTELTAQLNEIKTSLNNIQLSAGSDSDEVTVNVFRDSMYEVLNEITSLKDEYNYQSEKNDKLSEEINALKDEVFAHSSDTSTEQNNSKILDDLNEIKNKITSQQVTADSAVSEGIIQELTALKEIINKSITEQNASLHEVIQNINNNGNTEYLRALEGLKESFMIGKADTDNSFIIETASIREQLNVLKKTSDFDKIISDIGELKTALSQGIKTNVDLDNIRTAIREELTSSKGNDITQSIGALEQQLSQLRKELSKRQTADTATLNFMMQMISLLGKQNGTQSGVGNTALLSEISKLKNEIDSFKTVNSSAASSESQKFAERITSLKEDLSQIAQIADLDNSPNQIKKKEVLQEAVAIIEDDLSPKERLRRQLEDGGLPQDSADEIINSIYPENNK